MVVFVDCGKSLSRDLGTWLWHCPARSTVNRNVPFFVSA